MEGIKNKKTWEELMQETADRFGIAVMVKTKDRVDLYVPERDKNVD